MLRRTSGRFVGARLRVRWRGRRELMHGLFEWVDASVPDLDRAAAFYGALFGWEFAPPPGTDGSDYLLARRDGRVAAGLVRSVGRPGWNSYVSVDDVDAMARRVQAAGGVLVVPPVDIGSAGRMAFMVDPRGAAVGFWEARDHRGADAFNLPGFLTWNEIRTHDTAAARAFYADLMHEWSFTDQELEGGALYSMVRVGDRENAAVAPIGPQFGDAEDHWAVWFTVDDARADAARVEGLGGSAVGPVVETSYGPAARLADPFGSSFLVIGPMEPPSHE